MHLERRVLVSGGAGFLGSHLCEQLLSRGCQVLCVDNFFTGTRRNIEHLLAHKSFELLRHDITHPLFVEVDEITLQGRNIFINGAPVGFARSRTLNGTMLEIVEPGLIPPNRFYVQGTHEMSFDSRYRVNGLVRSDQIIGKATVIF